MYTQTFSLTTTDGVLHEEAFGQLALLSMNFQSSKSNAIVQVWHDEEAKDNECSLILEAPVELNGINLTPTEALAQAIVQITNNGQ